MKKTNKKNIHLVRFRVFGLSGCDLYVLPKPYILLKCVIVWPSLWKLQKMNNHSENGKTIFLNHYCYTADFLYDFFCMLPHSV